jgi:hypothetical protein
MYEWGGRQYLLVTASAGPGPIATNGSSSAGPVGVIAYALPKP